MQGSFQHGLDHTNTRAFLGSHKHGERRATPHPSHGRTRPAQPSPAPLPRPFRGTPGSGGAAAGPCGLRGLAGRGGSPWTRAPSRGQREELPRSCGHSGCGEREHRDPHNQHGREDWGEPQSPRATSPVPSRPEPPTADGPHHGTATAPRSRGHSDAPSWNREWDSAREMRGLPETPHSTQG